MITNCLDAIERLGLEDVLGPISLIINVLQCHRRPGEVLSAGGLEALDHGRIAVCGRDATEQKTSRLMEHRSTVKSMWVLHY